MEKGNRSKLLHQLCQFSSANERAETLNERIIYPSDNKLVSSAEDEIHRDTAGVEIAAITWATGYSPTLISPHVYARVQHTGCSRPIVYRRNF